MKIEGYEEISEEEHLKDSLGDNLYVYAWKTDTKHWFNKAQKFPIVFEDETNKIEVSEYSILIEEASKQSSIFFMYKGNFPLLVKAVEKAKEVAKKNEFN